MMCQGDTPANPNPQEPLSVSQPTILRRIPVAGFDPDGEPEIRVMSDGTLLIVFNFMPPSFAENDEDEFSDFDKQLEKAIGVPVQWEDREFFLIRSPNNDTADRIRAFLEGYRKNQRK
jgi:hypothetical protein